ncbi:hypothetical protein ACFQ1M_13745 [Sungkyunkwania multivorans]|uniref:Uncharacterized protein n=1 Tax=Sungkyunkwania multivorans TaxID=1173618 RepID=A0ABW3D1U2_9FLAO
MTIEGSLRGLNNKDTFKRTLEPGRHSYCIRNNGGGVLRFKIKTIDEGKWRVAETRSKIKSRRSVKGEFFVSDESANNVEFIFSKAFGAFRSEYELEYQQES